MPEALISPVTRVWQVGALCRAIADALDARFNPVSVSGEITGFSRAASGHCYFSIKDDTGQLRCAMFRRAAGFLDFPVRDGDRVEVRGRLGVYEARGELQLVVESMRKAGQGSLFEQFLQLKAKLEQEGLFDASRKRPLATLPRAIGVVTSLGAAALHDVVTALQRRVPHIPVVIAPASVQGENAPQELVRALEGLYRMVDDQTDGVTAPIDVILVVRGGGALEDLWAFNDERLARCMVASPVPVICGVGHETDFTIADFVADLRAPTPTAAAEMVCEPTSVWLGAVELFASRMEVALQRTLDRQSQRLDSASARISRPSELIQRQRLHLADVAHSVKHATRTALQQHRGEFAWWAAQWPVVARRAHQVEKDRLERAALRLELLDPALVLHRGYAWLTNENGQAIGSVAQTHLGQHVQATLVDGTVELTVSGPMSD